MLWHEHVGDTLGDTEGLMLGSEVVGEDVGDFVGPVVGETVGTTVGNDIVGLTVGEIVGLGNKIEQSDPTYPLLQVQSQPFCLFVSVVTPFPLQSLAE